MRFEATLRVLVSLVYIAAVLNSMPAVAGLFRVVIGGAEPLPWSVRTLLTTAFVLAIVFGLLVILPRAWLINGAKKLREPGSKNRREE